jgi:hypothetical protein
VNLVLVLERCAELGLGFRCCRPRFGEPLEGLVQQLAGLSNPTIVRVGALHLLAQFPRAHKPSVTGPKVEQQQ